MASLKDRKNTEALQTLAGERGSSGDFAQRVKQATELKVMIASLKTQASDIQTNISSAQTDLTSIQSAISDLENSVPEVSQTVTKIIGALGNGSSRQFLTGADPYGEWQDIVGTIAGKAIIEYGSTTNGSYVKIRGGFMMCMSPALVFDTIALSNGSIFKSAGVAWSFPKAFSATPHVSPAHASDGVWLAPYSATETDVSVRAMSATSRASVTKGYLIARGLFS